MHPFCCLVSVITELRVSISRCSIELSTSFLSLFPPGTHAYYVFTRYMAYQELMLPRYVSLPDLCGCKMPPIISLGQAHLCPRIKLIFFFFFWSLDTMVTDRHGNAQREEWSFNHFALCFDVILIAARPLPPLPPLIPKAIYPSVNLSFYLPLFDILPYLNQVSTAWAPALGWRVRPWRMWGEGCGPQKKYLIREPF